MEWNRPTRPNQPAQAAAPSNGTAVPHQPASHGGKKRGRGFSIHNLITVLLVFSVTVVILGLLSYAMLAKRQNEGRYVDGEKMQAVFLNGGQVYFGKIRALNNNYVGLTDIYYLRVNQQVQPKDGQQAQQDISLVKLGCELHGPSDEMLINRDQVVFWENLKSDGQVAKAVDEYIKANPDGQKCDAQTTGQNQQQQQQAETKKP